MQQMYNYFIEHRYFKFQNEHLTRIAWYQMMFLRKLDTDTDTDTEFINTLAAG